MRRSRTSSSSPTPSPSPARATPQHDTPAAADTPHGTATEAEKSPGEPYHHGSLREGLLDAARAILEREGLTALSLRAVAREAGVSWNAPYRHYADRRALVAAVAARGFDELQSAMRRAMSGDAGRAGFKGVAHAYLAFARRHPALYRVMFGPEVAERDDLPELASSSHGALQFVQGAIERLQSQGLVRQGSSSHLAITTWAALHGLTSLILDGQGGTSDEIDALLETQTQVLMLGMAPRQAAR